MDLENIGNAALVTFAIISSVLWISYIMDSRYAVQRFFLEPVSKINGFQPPLTTT